MDQRGKSIAIGVFASIGIIVLGYLVLLFGEAPSIFVGGVYNVNIHFDKGIAMTREGTEVLLAGKRIGQVREITFIDPEDMSRGVKVIAEIEKKYRLPVTATAMEAVTSIVMARAIILISYPPGAAGTPLVENDGFIGGVVQPLLDNILPPSMMPTLEKTISKIGELSEALTPVAKELEDLIRQRSLQQVDDPNAKAMANLSTVIQRFDVVLRDVHSVLGDPSNQTNIKQTIENLHQASVQLNTALADARNAMQDIRTVASDIRAGIGETRQVIAKMDGMLDGLSGSGMDTLDAAGRMFLEVEELARRANQGQGSMGQFLNDNRLYESLVLTAERMQKTLDDFQKVLEQWRKGDLKLKVF